MYTITITYDQDPDFSWVDLINENPADHVMLEMALYDHDWKVVDSLCNIDFYEAANDWIVGKFSNVADIPASCPYLREIAEGMVEGMNRAEADRYLSLL